MSDQVNSPSHYTKGRVEAIEIIEDVVAGAPDPVAGYLVGQTLKYLLRARRQSQGEHANAESSLRLTATGTSLQLQNLLDKIGETALAEIA